jgi:hypothetical protein
MLGSGRVLRSAALARSVVISRRKCGAGIPIDRGLPPGSGRASAEGPVISKDITMGLGRRQCPSPASRVRRPSKRSDSSRASSSLRIDSKFELHTVDRIETATPSEAWIWHCRFQVNRPDYSGGAPPNSRSSLRPNGSSPAGRLTVLRAREPSGWLVSDFLGNPLRS